MKRLMAIFLATVLLLCGCTLANYRDDITMDEIVEVYKGAGYSVWAEVYDEKLDEGEVASIQANYSDGNYIYFSVFETEEEAKAYKEEYYHPFAMWFFSVIYGESLWPRWKVYGCVVVQYTDPDLLEPFQELLKST